MTVVAVLETTVAERRAEVHRCRAGEVGPSHGDLLAASGRTRARDDTGDEGEGAVVEAVHREGARGDAAGGDSHVDGAGSLAGEVAVHEVAEEQLTEVAAVAPNCTVVDPARSRCR